MMNCLFNMNKCILYNETFKIITLFWIWFQYLIGSDGKREPNWIFFIKARSCKAAMVTLFARFSRVNDHLSQETVVLWNSIYWKPNSHNTPCITYVVNEWNTNPINKPTRRTFSNESFQIFILHFAKKIDAFG